MGFINKIIKSEADPNLIIFEGYEKGLSFYTEDCGESIVAFKHDKFISNFIPSKTQKNWWLGISKTPCEEISEEPCTNTKGMFLTQDKGKTWKFLISSITDILW